MVIIWRRSCCWERIALFSDIVPAYMTDALLRRVNVDRYDDREVIQTNLIESYEQLMEFWAQAFAG